MEVLQNRIDSFTRSKRVKNGSKTTVTLKWPHPSSFQANPETLAEAGFYYDPSPEDRDSVTCYMCSKQLSEWDSDDDPFDIHYRKCAKTCSWAVVRCGLRNDVDHQGRFVSQNKNRMPLSKVMEKARLDTFTFGDGWPHDSTKNGCTSKKMARAGFIYMPQEPGDDLATCLYCGVSLSGWDDDDDPLRYYDRSSPTTQDPKGLDQISFGLSRPLSR
ncbi:inhibitor of apoptosis repeat-containing protein [Armillaria solidipes]|uniref:Inhibitor of apoptosis repeat-containing protein n=1 Tax=Armillaria solidipes TaxID=1076256 RepID=A0A2H3BJG7_9AGAR|nr:inhibitor of apoptosis repeat-containing protein [Armillaria solidipes]